MLGLLLRGLLGSLRRILALVLLIVLLGLSSVLLHTLRSCLHRHLLHTANKISEWVCLGLDRWLLCLMLVRPHWLCLLLLWWSLHGLLLML